MNVALWSTLLPLPKFATCAAGENIRKNFAGTHFPPAKILDGFRLNSVLRVDTEVWAVILILEQTIRYEPTLHKNYTEKLPQVTHTETDNSTWLKLLVTKVLFETVFDTINTNLNIVEKIFCIMWYEYWPLGLLVHKIIYLYVTIKNKYQRYIHNWKTYLKNVCAPNLITSTGTFYCRQRHGTAIRDKIDCIKTTTHKYK